MKQRDKIISEIQYKNKSGIFKYSQSNFEKTRFQVLELSKFNTIKYVKLKFSPIVLKDLSLLARIHLLPKKPEIGSLCLFSLPTGLGKSLPELFINDSITDPVSSVRYLLNKAAENGDIRIENGYLISFVTDINILLTELTKMGLLSLIETSSKGRLLFIPVSENLGYLSSQYDPGKILMNSHFFLLDLTDLESCFDIMGELYGLLMLNGKIISPPLYPRSALFIGNNGKSSIETVSIKDMKIVIDNIIYSHGNNCSIFIRPEFEVSPQQRGIDIAVVGSRILAFSGNGGLDIPEAGYVIHINKYIPPGSLTVEYVPFGGYFGIQVGPPLIIDGKQLSDFKEPFYNGDGIKYPPTVYPQNWETGKAARLGIGTSVNGKISVIWAEGSKAQTYRPGVDSRGVSLSEFAEIADTFKMKNFINLDGGGSSQIAVKNTRSLFIADRIKETGKEFERPIPIGLGIDLH